MDLNEEDRKSLESFDTNLTGSELEEKFFNNLQQVMEKSKIKDTFIISGWSDKGLSDRGPKNRKMREFFIQLFILICYFAKSAKIHKIKSCEKS